MRKRLTIPFRSSFPRRLVSPSSSSSSPLLPPRPSFFLPTSSAAAASSSSSSAAAARFPRLRFCSSSVISPPMESPSRSSPISFSGPGSILSGGEDAGLVTDPSAPGGSAAGSLQGADGVLSAPASGGGEDAEFGFQRPEFGRDPLAGTVQIYERHVFLCYKSPAAWPTHVEGAESDRLPRLLAAEIKAHQRSMSRKTRLTICEGEDGTDSSNGDVLIFPDMMRYRRMTHFDVQNFVEEVLINNGEWLAGGPQKLAGSYVFVCAHGSRDKRCGVCGPALIKRFKEEIEAHNLQGQIFVSACSHIGGHKYAGNVIIFSPNSNGEVIGHWYGYVAPDDVPVLLDQHIGKGKIVDRLWRGQMGLSEEDQKAAQDRRLQLNGETDNNTSLEPIETAKTDGCAPGAAGCCQGAGNSGCCQVMPKKEGEENLSARDQEVQNVAQNSNAKDIDAASNKGPSKRKICPMPTWFETWEREDTYAALATVAAIASVAVAYSYYRQLR